MIRRIVLTILALGLAGTAYWGYREHRDKNAVFLHAENNYQRAFHDLSYQMDLLHDKIGTTLAMNSRKSLSPALTEVWMITQQAHSDVGQLPLTLLPFNKTEAFLANIGKFSYKTAVRDLDKKPLNRQEYATLKSLYHKSSDIQNELRHVQYLVLKNNLRWMDVEMALGSGKQQTDNTIIDGLKIVERTVAGYDETEFGPTFPNMQKEEKNLKKIQGKKISRIEAGNIAKSYMNIDKKASVKIAENKQGSDYGFYSITLKNPKTNGQASIDITKKGGYPIWFINSRPVTKQTISLYDAGQRAAAFLKEAGFKQRFELFESSQYDNIGVFDFVTKQRNIIMYPESIKIKVALDDGSIVGFSANEYLASFQTKRKIPSPKISKKIARSKVNPNLKIMEVHKAVITNDLNKEVLCYEFLGVMNNDTYRIFINASNGQEEEVQKLKNTEAVYQDTL